MKGNGVMWKGRKEDITRLEGVRDRRQIRDGSKSVRNIVTMNESIAVILKLTYNGWQGTEARAQHSSCFYAFLELQQT